MGGLSSVRAKIVILLGVIILISVLIISYVNVTMGKTVAMRDAQNTVKMSFINIKTEVENWVIYVIREMDRFSSRRPMTEFIENPTDQKKYELVSDFKILLSVNPEFSNFFVSDLRGKILVTARYLPFTTFYPFSCEYESVKDAVKNVPGTSLKVVVECLKNSKGLITGYFVGILNFSPLYRRIYEKLQDLFQGISWGLIVCNKDGEVLFHAGIGEGCDSRNFSSGKSYFENEKYFNGFYFDDILDNYIQLVMLKEDIGKNYYYGIVRLAVVVSLLFLVSVVIISFMLRGILRPIDNLLWAAKKVSEGELNITIPVRTKDEIGELIKVFNHMLERLRDDKLELETAHNELRDAYRRLEIMNKTLSERNKELEAVNSKLQILSITDSLTGLYNHRYLQETLEKELRMARRVGYPLSYLMLDIDDFKIFNDTYGHQSGDALLSQLGGLISKQLRSTDIATRYGGEEFGLILPNTDKEGSIYIGGKIRMMVSHYPFKIKRGEKEIEVHVTISVGASTKKPFVVGPHSREEIIEEADKALYEAKREGKNRVVHYQDIAGQIKDQR